MASPCEILVESEDLDLINRLAKLIAQEAWRIEQKYSRYRDDNPIYRINHAQGQPVSVDSETATLIDFADQLFSLSGGMFDATSGVLRKAWKFDGGSSLPTKNDVEKILSKVGWQRIQWKNSEIVMEPGMELDFGGFGKEYAVDRAALMALRETGAPVLVNFGGDLCATAAPSQGSWNIGLESISTGTEVEGVIGLARGAIATSGDAFRYIEKDGVRYPHILNPKTGWPVESAPRSVTVLAQNCVEAGFISTMAMLQGSNAEHFLAEQEVKYWIQRD